MNTPSVLVLLAITEIISLLNKLTLLMTVAVNNNCYQSFLGLAYVMHMHSAALLVTFLFNIYRRFYSFTFLKQFLRCFKILFERFFTSVIPVG